MRRGTAAVVIGAAVLAAAGCGESHPAAKNPVPAGAEGQPAKAAPAEEIIQIDAGKGDKVRVGPAIVSLGLAREEKYDGIPILQIGLLVECPKEAPSFVVKGWSADFALIETLIGKAVDRSRGPDPLPVTFTATADGLDKCRAVERMILVPKPGGKNSLPVGTKELKVGPGDQCYLLYEVERPGKAAKELVLDVAGEDFGHAGRVKVRVPAKLIARE